MADREHRFQGPGSLERTLALVRYLRIHCPWDADQTAESLIPHLLEETHEVIDAIRDGDADGLEDELGDLLLNLAFQIVVAEEDGTLDGDSVYRRLEAKMIARHPHVFGDAEHRDWERSKAEERGEEGGVLDGLATGLDPLTKAFRIQERVAGVGFDWEDHLGPLEKVREELDEAAHAIASASGPGGSDDGHPKGGSGEAGRADAGEPVVEEIGDLFFAVVNLARLVGVHPTTALARANHKFRGRFQRLEALAAERDVELGRAGLAALDALWDEVKRGEKAPPEDVEHDRRA